MRREFLVKDMDIELAYGNGNLSLDLAKYSKVQQIQSNEAINIPNISDTLQTRVSATNLFREIHSSNPRNSTIAIVVDNAHRFTEYETILLPLIDVLRTTAVPSSNISVIYSYPPHLNDKLKNERSKLTCLEHRDVNLHFHKPEDDHSIRYVGNEPTHDFPIYLNSLYTDATHRIIVSDVMQSAFYGVTGGFYSIAPGVCGSMTQSQLLKLQSVFKSEIFHPHSEFMGPVHAVAQYAPPSLVVSIVKDAFGNVADALVSETESSWMHASTLAKELATVRIKNRVDVAIVGSGGHPFDYTLYDACESLYAGLHATKTGGTIILLSESLEGFGPYGFVIAFDRDTNSREISQKGNQEYVLGMERAFFLQDVLKQRSIILCSSLNEGVVEKKLGIINTDDPSFAVESAMKHRGLNRDIGVISHGPFVNPA